ncbi:MAG: hypothetical protein ACSNEK_09685 [Parachlamydiaceae bacterium]
MVLDIGQALAQTNSFVALEPLVKAASPKLSFWGARRMTVRGYQGELKINSLVSKTLALREANPHFDQVERAAGKKIAAKLNQIYEISDRQVRTANLITKLFAYIRMLWEPGDEPYGDRMEWEVIGMNEIFEKYTQDQYENVFGKPYPYPGCSWMRVDEKSI